MNIGIDVDGVLIDFEERFRYKAEMFDFLERNNVEIKDKNSYVIEEKYNWDGNDWNKFADKYLIQLTKESNLIPGAKEVFNLLKNDNHKLYLISARGSELDDMITIINEKLKKEGLIFDKYFWKIKNKLEVVNNENVDVMIDDNPNTCKKLADGKVKTMYFRNAYGEKLNESQYLIEVKNWGEIYRYIKRI